MIKLFERALATFWANDLELVTSNASERSWCARLACYLEQEVTLAKLEGYNADTEYNRMNATDVKVILDGNAKSITIVADIVLHRRRKNQPNDNLIAIEMKKAVAKEDLKLADWERLRAMTKPLGEVHILAGEGTVESVSGYQLGVYLEIDPKIPSYKFKCFSGGDEIVPAKPDA